MNFFTTAKKYIHDRPKLKKAIGILLILYGLVALVSPFTPGSWLVFIGLELLGIQILFLDRLRRRFPFLKKDLPKSGDEASKLSKF